MALVFPDDILSFDPNAMALGFRREWEVLRHLQTSLPDSYCLFHGVEWHTVFQGDDRFGELDLVLMGPSGDIVLIEIKAGSVEECDDGLFKTYNNGSRKDVSRQCRVQHGAMVQRFKEARIRVNIAQVLLLPDYEMKNSGSVAYPRQRILDALDYRDIGNRLQMLLPKGNPSKAATLVKQFLLNVFRVAPCLDVLQGQLRQATRRLSEGLAIWVPRLTVPQGVVHIKATAGSGKTQLAVRLLTRAVEEDKRPLYVCFSRPLADQIRRLVPEVCRVTTFHDLVVDHYRKEIGTPDFSLSETLKEATELYLQESHQLLKKYDVLVVDEGQDLHPDWLQAIRSSSKLEGRFFLLEDDDQRLYETTPHQLNDAVVIHCNDNFRSPKTVVEMIDAMGLSSSNITAQGLYRGDLPTFRAYDDDRSLLQQTGKAVRHFLTAGYKLENIAVLSFAGLARSKILRMEALESWPLRRFTGSYTKEGEQIWTQGNLLVDTVYRFKGRAAPAIVFTEIDFESLGEREKRKLFVGLTRAQMAVELVGKSTVKNLFRDWMKN